MIFLNIFHSRRHGVLRSVNGGAGEGAHGEGWRARGYHHLLIRRSADILTLYHHAFVLTCPVLGPATSTALTFSAEISWKMWEGPNIIITMFNFGKVVIKREG